MADSSNLPNVYGADEFAADYNVSRETLEKITRYYELLQAQQGKINLVSAASLDDFWHRHASDSAQLLRYLPDNKTEAPLGWLDIGSGGGFPALIIALLCPQIAMILVESDQRKARFLTNSAAELGCAVQVENTRAESLKLEGVNIISARAVAPINKLLPLISPYFAANSKLSTTALLHRGANWQTELTQAQKKWKLDYVAHQSLTNPASRILAISGIKAVKCRKIDKKA